MNTGVVCPRCGQDCLERVRLVALKHQAVKCPECDALWLNEEDVGPPAEGSYGVTWFDYGSFMKESGRSCPQAESECVVLGPLTR